MNVGEIHTLVERVAAIDASCRDRDVLTAAAGDVHRLQSWLQSRETIIAACLAKVASFPEKALADATRTSLRHAETVTKRAATTETMPAFANALADGAVSGDHIDIVGRALDRLPPGLRPLLADQADTLADAAGQATPRQFQDIVADAVRKLETDDGMSRLARQRRNTRLREWVDKTTGMYHFAGAFDPVTGNRIATRLRTTINALFAESTPDTCPTDPFAKTEHLRALAFAAIIDGAAPGGRSEIIVVVNATDTDSNGHPLVEWAIPVEIPHRVLADLLTDADIDVHTIIIRNGTIIHAPGTLNLGHTTRLANRAQRRALRALYPTCPVPGCDTGFDFCTIHHITWWEHGGPTDFDNLWPTCSRHHHAIHNLGWHIHLGPNRELTITLPDGTRLTNAPPRTRPP